jgi:hypothetical protein
MVRRAAAGSGATRPDRARRAFELALAGNSTRKISELMQGEGYRNVGHVTVSRMIKDYGQSLVLPLAQEHVTREYERLMEQRLRLDEQRARAWEICNRFHFATNNQGVIMVYDPDGEKGPNGEPPLRAVRDSGPELQALKVMQGIEDLVLKNADALAKLFGYRAPEETKVTVTTELDAAVADLVGEMNARDAAAPSDVRA